MTGTDSKVSGTGRLWALIIDHSLLLVSGAVAGMVWTNVDHSSYARVSQALRFSVNDIGMVFFFTLAVKEIVEATLPGGPLGSPREGAVPLLAAVGGMIGPAALYVLLSSALGRPELMRGWAIPCATDIAFSYGTARLIFPRDHPAIPFLLLLAIADDAMGLILLAVFYPAAQGSLPQFIALMVPALTAGAWLRRRQTTTFWPYLTIAGGLSWAALFVGGFHPALAMVPVVPFMPHAKRDLGIFDPREPEFSDGRILDEVKMGALTSLLAAPIAIGLGRLVGLRPNTASSGVASL